MVFLTFHSLITILEYCEIRSENGLLLLSFLLSPHVYFSFQLQGKIGKIKSWYSQCYGGPQVHSEFQTTLQICKHIPNSKTSLPIRKTHSQFQKLTPNSKTSIRILKTHSEF